MPVPAAVCVCVSNLARAFTNEKAQPKTAEESFFPFCFSILFSVSILCTVVLVFVDSRSEQPTKRTQFDWNDIVGCVWPMFSLSLMHFLQENREENMTFSAIVFVLR